MRVIIAGGRGFFNYELLAEKMDAILKNQRVIEIVSGDALGADQLGKRYAKERGYPVKLFPADWSLGRMAGPLRNEQMSIYATHCVCFWNGQSRGTKSMIELAGIYKLQLRVIKY